MNSTIYHFRNQAVMECQIYSSHLDYTRLQGEEVFPLRNVTIVGFLLFINKLTATCFGRTTIFM
jgi:hypothetical protein